MRDILEKNMIKSMTGYGKAECQIEKSKYCVEIRSVNGKGADVSLKTSLIPREKEVEIRKLIAQKLTRGNIDLFINKESISIDGDKQINKDVLKGYLAQIQELRSECSEFDKIDDTSLMSTLLRMPDVIESKKDELSEDEWNTLLKAINDAIDNINSFRCKEGESLYADLTEKVSNIEKYLHEVAQYEEERISQIRDRINNKLSEIKADSDGNRLEQEIIYYIEKLDINEEKVRLKQHCNYFRETLENEENPGKKLGFIAQEMGREINTMGSKANHHEIQKLVVKMKDELEKIKEQSLNIL